MPCIFWGFTPFRFLRTSTGIEIKRLGTQNETFQLDPLNTIFAYGAPQGYRCSMKLSFHEWELALRHHYLSSLGPYGAATITEIDATPSELKAAIGRPDLDDADVAASFCGLFNRDGVRDILDRNEISGAAAFRNFRYLLLSCHVTATTINAGDSRNFRHRLGEILGGGEEQGVRAVNRAWAALADHLDLLINRGEPWRKLQLVDPGHRTLIGHAVDLAYPSWIERRALRDLLRSLPDSSFENWLILIDKLGRSTHALPERLAEDVEELANHCRRSPEAAFRHKAWRLVQSLLSEISKTDKTRPMPVWRVSLSLSGIENDEARVEIFRGARRGDLGDALWTGSLAELFLERGATIPGPLRKMLEAGSVILQEERGGTWGRESKGLDEGIRSIILTSRKSVATRLGSYRQLIAGWAISNPMSLDEARAVIGHPVFEVSNEPNEFRFENGIPVERGAFLSRRGFLPDLRSGDAGDIIATPGRPELPQIEFEINGEACRIVQPDAPVGQWRITSSTTGAVSSLLLVRNAAIRTEWPYRQARFEPAEELVYADGDELISVEAPVNEGTAADGLLDALEVLVARGGAPRGEAEVIDVLRKVLPDPRACWDLLRSIEEAGWLERDVSLSWRARLWRVRPPIIVRIGAEVSLVEGALGAAAIEFLAGSCRDARITLRLDARLPWAPPVIGLFGGDHAKLATTLGWSMMTASSPKVNPAPLCWPDEARTTEGRRPAGIWIQEAGIFVDPKSVADRGTELFRHVRDDDRDLFRVGVGDDAFMTSERVAAILEWARRARRPIFNVVGATLRRRTMSGALPLPVATWLRRAAGRQAGLVISADGKRHYEYPLGEGHAKFLFRLFGAAIELNEGVVAAPMWRQFARRRHLGARPMVPDILRGRY